MKYLRKIHPSFPLIHRRGGAFFSATVMATALCFSSVVPVRADDSKGKAHDMGAATMAAPASAVAVLAPTKGHDVRGVIHFKQEKAGVRVTGEIMGLSPGTHGFHVHQFGDVTAADGTSAGGHFNPMHKDHGARTSADRHVGDLGNIEADANGTARVDFVDPAIALSGPASIIGRGVIVHAGADDFKTQPTGDAGGRVAAGVIGITKD